MTARPPEPKTASFIHATAVVIAEAGVLIFGASGTGKSSLALLLIAEASRRGLFGRLVGDDRVSVEALHGAAVVKPHGSIAGLIECRSVGIVPLRHEVACVAKLAVELHPETVALPRLPEEEDYLLLACGLRLPRLRLRPPVSAMSCHLVFQRLSQL